MSHRNFLYHIDKHIPKVEFDNYDKAIFILHEQLNLEVWPEWVREEKPLLIFMESKAKEHALPYHKKKLVYVLSSMRHFAIECHQAGYPVYYYATTNHFGDGLGELFEETSDIT